MTTLLLANETTKLPSDGKEIGYQDYVYDNDKETTTNKHQQQQYRSVFFRYMDGRTYCLWLDPTRVTVLHVKLMLLEHVQTCNELLPSCADNECRPQQRLSSLMMDTSSSKQSIASSSPSTTTLATTTTTRGKASAAESDLCMVWQGKPLDDDCILSHVITPLLLGNNSNNTTTTIVVWQRQRGGCFMVSLSILVIIFFALLSSCCTCGLSLLVVPVLLPLLFILPLFCL